MFSPAQLLSKDPRTGNAVPWNPSPQCWIDGSVDNDLPMTRLAEMFNVNHFIVSQVNPHVIPFLIKEEDNSDAELCHASPSQLSTGPGWMHSLASIARDEALHRMHVLSEMGIFPNLLTKTRSVLSQRYSGDITVCPTIPYSHFPKVLSNPDSDFMLQATLAGEQATWPKLSRIQNHCAIELALDDAVQQLRARVAFSPSQVDLRLNSIDKPLSREEVGPDQLKHRDRRTGLDGHPFKSRKSFSSMRSEPFPSRSLTTSNHRDFSRDLTIAGSRSKLGASFQLTPKPCGSPYDSSDNEDERSTSPTSLSPEDESSSRVQPRSSTLALGRKDYLVSEESGTNHPFRLAQQSLSPFEQQAKRSYTSYLERSTPSWSESPIASSLSLPSKLTVPNWDSPSQHSRGDSRDSNHRRAPASGTVVSPQNSNPSSSPTVSSIRKQVSSARDRKQSSSGASHADHSKTSSECLVPNTKEGPAVRRKKSSSTGMKGLRPPAHSR